MSNTLRSYFGSKKKDLNDKSNDRDERKKAKESNLDLSLNQDGADAFSGGFDSPRCASILYDCLNNLDKKVNEIHLLSTTTNDAQIKGTRQLMEVNGAIKFINENFEEFEADRKKKEQEIAELKSTINSLNVRLDKADRALDCQEQYSRRNCFLIHGIDEENQENADEVVINVLKKEMDEEITHQDIDRSHRLGNRKLGKNKPQPIIIKFLRYNVSVKIFKNKIKLQRKRISVKESLTKLKMEKLLKTREEHSFRNVWFNDRKILYIDVNNHNRVKVFCDYFFKSWLRFWLFYDRKKFCMICFLFLNFNCLLGYLHFISF